jgi:hypothetical protein
METETKRPNWLVALLNEIDAFDGELFPCPVSKKDADVVVGEIPPYYRKVYSLGRYYTREQKRLEVEVEFEHSEDQCARVSELQHRVSMLMEIFWFGCRLELKQFHPPGVGIRSPWLFVLAEDDKKVRFRDFLDGISGAGFLKL